MTVLLTAVFFILLTIAMYMLMNMIYVRFNTPFLVPILTTTIVIIIILSLFNVSYETYMIGGEWINAFLGPAIVSLCVPLYKQRDLLKRYLYPIISGVLVGSIVGISTGVLMAKLFQFSDELIATILPKSITTPIAMQVAEELGGIPSLATVFVIVAGLVGILVDKALYKWIKIDTALGRGIGLGAAAHAIGTSKAIEYGEQEASMSSVAMTLSAIIGSVLGPVFGFLM